MGAHTFYNEYYGTLSVRDAYNDLVQEALHESGHDPYNGTISTTSGVKLVGVEPMTLEKANKLAGERIMNLSKWEHCEAIPLVQEQSPTFSAAEKETVEISVSGTVFNDAKLLHAELHRLLKLKPGDVIDGWSNVAPDFRTRTTKVERGSKTEATKEKAVTKYFVLTSRDHGKLPAWEDGYATQAQARAAISNHLYYEFNGVPAVDAEVIGITRRESGAPLVKGTAFAKKVTGPLTVRFRRMVNKGSVGKDQAGYLFYGWAAS